MTSVLNALVATSNRDAQLQAIEAWLRAERSRTANQTEEQSSAGSSSTSKTITELLRESCKSADDEE